MTKRFAFTLAEVLIALAIIGVVAAMTIPTFMANTAGAQFRTGFKKGISVLTQAAATNYATDDYDFAGTNAWFGGADAATPANDGKTVPIASARIGFNTLDETATAAAASGNLDMVGNAQSLYHIFKNNLNMKNSNEIANYSVGINDPSLDCTGVTTMKVNVPGVNTSQNVQAKDATGLVDRSVLKGRDETIPTASAATLFKGGIANLCGGRAVKDDGTEGFNQGRMFALEDGMVFTYDPAQAACTETHPCYGYIDVNGSTGPNRVVSCSSGANNSNAYIRSYGRTMQDLPPTTGENPQVATAEAGVLMAACSVEAKDITDIFPVLFYGSTVKPASLAAKSVYYSQKSNQIP